MAMLPGIDEINKMTEINDFNKVVTLLFEPAPPLTEKLFTMRPFDSFKQMLQNVTEIINNKLTEKEMITVVNAHPRIGAPTQTLSKLSKTEQSSKGPITSQETLDQLKQLNQKYEEKHGFKFVVFVNGRSRDEIVPILKDRIEKDTETELSTGLSDMVLIANDRLNKLQQANPPKL